MNGRLKRLDQRRLRLQSTIEGQREDLAAAAKVLKSRFVKAGAPATNRGTDSRGFANWPALNEASGNLLDVALVPVLAGVVRAFIRHPALVALGGAGLIAIGPARRRVLGQMLASAASLAIRTHANRLVSMLRSAMAGRPS